jgi:hypothetical protein
MTCATIVFIDIIRLRDFSFFQLGFKKIIHEFLVFVYQVIIFLIVVNVVTFIFEYLSTGLYVFLKKIPTRFPVYVWSKSTLTCA